MRTTTFDKFAGFYDKVMGEAGDYTHQNTIDPALIKVAGKIEKRVIYDIGCGNGSLVRKLIKKGAKEVWASDISSSLINIAKTKYSTYGINYFICEGCDLKKFPKEYFDLVTLNMSIHYIKDLDILFKNIRQIIKKGGRVAFTTAHPLKSAVHLDTKRIKTCEEFLESTRGYLEGGKKLIYNPWTRNEDLVIYSRPLEKYITTLVKYSFQVTSFIEPETRQLTSYFGGKRVFSKIPAYLAIAATKTAR